MYLAEFKYLYQRVIVKHKALEMPLLQITVKLILDITSQLYTHEIHYESSLLLYHEILYVGVLQNTLEIIQTIPIPLLNGPGAGNVAQPRTCPRITSTHRFRSPTINRQQLCVRAWMT